MRLLLNTALMLSVFAGILGCSSTESQSSPESVRDPLGIDRAINDYYFPDGIPASADDFDAVGDDAAQDEGGS